MSVNPSATNVDNTTQPADQNGQKTNDKEYNFVQIRKQLESKNQENQQLKEELEKIKKVSQDRLTPPDDDDDDEPYVDRKRLKRELGKVVQQTATETESKIQDAVNRALGEERQRQWLSQHNDFEQIMQHAQKIQDSDPELADIILNMPNTFERHKLVYKHIKATGLHNPAPAKTNIQDKIDANRRSPFYQPSGIPSPGYGIVNGGKEYSDTEMKSAYDVMQQSKRRLRI
jgi:hypothetical protein